PTNERLRLGDEGREWRDMGYAGINYAGNQEEDKVNSYKLRRRQRGKLYYLFSFIFPFSLFTLHLFLLFS
ncbi:MAG: hypothetical protein UHT92_04625, partial [Prevotella sp.]|nr:hypothetical protein [Prevotella sp.]